MNVFSISYYMLKALHGYDEESKSALSFAFPQSSESEVHFDVEIAIKVLRQAGYHSHAVFLAEKHMHHEWYLKIQLEDLKVKTVKTSKWHKRKTHKNIFSIL